MKIILKFILKSIKDNKFRTFLILISIVLSSALFFASSAISGTIAKMYLTRIRQYYGSADIIIYSGRNSDWTFYLENAIKLKDKFDYIVGAIENWGDYKPNRNDTYSVDLKGIDLEDLGKCNPITINEEDGLYPFDGKKIIINKIVSDKYNLKLNDNFDVEIFGDKQRFTVCGIALPVGPFLDDGRTILGIVPKETLAALNDRRGKVSIAYLKLRNFKEKEMMIGELHKLYPRHNIREAFNDAELREDTNRMSVPFLMMTTLVLLVSMFIIYSSFKVITMERLPVIGTFRSIGATKRTTDLVLIIESLTYGAIGGIIGCLLGIIILYVMTSIMGNNPWDSNKMEIEVYFDFSQLFGAFMVALVLSLASSIAPIIKISKIPVKDIVLNKIEKDVKIKSWKTNLGAFFFIVSLLIPVFVPSKFAIIMGISSMIVSIVGIILLIPVLTNMVIKLFEKFYHHIFGNVGLLAARNLHENKSILNNITLIAIGISTILMINTVSFTVVNETSGFYRKADFQIWLWFYQADRSLESRLKSIKGVSDVFGTYNERNVEVYLSGDSQKKNGNRQSADTISAIHGINKEKYKDYWKFDIDDKLLGQLDDERNIIFTYSLKTKFGVEKGDTVRLLLNNTERSYRIIGFFSSMRNNGNYALVSDRYLKVDSNNYYYDEIYMKTSLPADDVVAKFKKKFGQWGYWISTTKQMEENEAKSNEQLFMILKGFSFLTLIIGIFGVLNNFIISFIERRRHLAIFRSVGMSKKQVVMMLFVEALSGGLIGGILGVLSGIVMIFTVEYVIRGMNMFVKMNYSPILFAYSIISGIVITVFASISPALKSSKLNIIEAIKYE
jgi:putative ABC transport system permease protein